MINKRALNSKTDGTFFFLNQPNHNNSYLYLRPNKYSNNGFDVSMILFLTWVPDSKENLTFQDYLMHIYQMRHNFII